MTATVDLIDAIQQALQSISLQAFYPPPRQVDDTALPFAIIIPKDGAGGAAGASIYRVDRTFRIEVLLRPIDAGDIPDLSTLLDDVYQALSGIPYTATEDAITDTGLTIVPYLGGDAQYWGTVFNIVLRIKQGG